MQMVPITVSAYVSESIADAVTSVLETAQVLLAAYQHANLDRTSDRGRYMLSALQAHQRALLHRLVDHSNDLLQEEVSCIELFQCDYQAVLGADAEKCYVNATLRLHKQLLSNMETAAPVKVHRDHHYSELHCASNQLAVVDASNCHLQYAIMRQARHLLLHAVDPVHTLNVLQSKYVALRSEESAVWQVLSYCFLGLCTNKHVSVHTHSTADGTVVITYESPIAQITIAVDVVVRECDAILGYLQAHGDNDVVHALFTKACCPFHQLQHRLTSSSTKAIDAADSKFAANKRTIIDQSRTMVATLLSMGAMEVAALHTINVLDYALDFSVAVDDVALDSGLNTSTRSELQQFLALYPSLRLLLPHATSTSNGDSAAFDALLDSPNVRAALQLLHILRRIKKIDTHWHSFLGNSDLLSNFLNVIFHVTSPVILSAPGFTPAATAKSVPAADVPTNSVPVTWLQEAALLRYIVVHTLRTLVDACEGPVRANVDILGTTTADVKCEIIDPASSVGARGLFLLAYQGLGLTTENLESAVRALRSATTGKNDEHERTPEDKAAMVRELSTFLCDSTVPMLYQNLLRLSSAEISSVPPFSRTPASITSQSTSVAAPFVESGASATAIATRRIKVAFLSPFFRRHPVGRLLVKVIAHVDHMLFDVHIVTIAQEQQTDDVTAYLRQHIIPEKWIYISHNMPTAADTVRAQQFDAIVYGDVFMDANMAHFATIRLAPVQVCFWGHPFTTGYETMDYFITSDKFEQKNSHFRYAIFIFLRLFSESQFQQTSPTLMYCRHSQYSEQLVRFDSLSFQLIEPEADPIGSSTVSTAAGTPAAVGSVPVGPTDAVESPWQWPDVPAYTRRSSHSAWDHGLQTWEHRINQAFFERRRDVLRWVTSVGFDIHNMPINDADLIETLHPGSTDSWNSIQSTTTDPVPAATLHKVVASVRLYGALQSLFKMHPLFDLAIAEILTRDEHALILLSRNGRQRHWEQSFRGRLANTLRSYAGRNKTHSGMSEQEIKIRENSLLAKVLFVNQMQHTQYQTLVCSLDVTLDTFPFGGGVTLSDALGGCGLNTQQAMFHQDVRDISHHAVPFVTSGQLQSVHQIGAGIAEKLGPKMADFAYSTATARELLSAQSSADLTECLHNSTAVACIGRGLVSQLETSHALYIDEYAAAAVALASKSQMRKMHATAVQEGVAEYSSAQKSINDVLYNSLDAANEWSLFLHYVVLSDQQK